MSFLHTDLEQSDQIYDGNFSCVYVVNRKGQQDKMILKVYKSEEEQ